MLRIDFYTVSHVYIYCELQSYVPELGLQLSPSLYLCPIIPQLWVNEERGVVYFEGNTSSSLEKHLYVHCSNITRHT